MHHAPFARRPFRSRRRLAACCLLLSACTATKDAPTAPIAQQEVVAYDGPSINVAAAANGGTAAASSVHSSGWFPLSGTINGDRLGLNWGNGGGWNDGTFAQWPDWLEVSFAGSQTINEIDVFTIQDDYRAPVTPTLALTTIAGLTDFRIESWTGSAWVVVPGGTITGTNKVWTQVTFAPITTTKIRVWITSSLDNWSRVAELEAWTVAGTVPGAFGKTSPTQGAAPAPSGITLSWAASSGATSYEYCVDTTNNGACDGSWVSTTSLSATLGALTTGTPYWWQVRARNATGTTDANGGTWWSFTPATGGARVNVAAAANGGAAAASSVHGSGLFPLSGTINGDRLGLNWGNGGGWNDGTFAQWPDWLEVSFAGSQTINEIDVFTIQDDYRAPVTPTLSLTTIAGLTDFRIESWNGSAWVVVPGGTVTGTNKVWTQVTFAPITTTKIRVWITSSLDSWSRVAELEAWTVSGGALPSAFAKTSPTNGAAPAPSGITLNWAASSGATSYEYCVDTTNNGACDGSWVSTTALSATLGTLTAGTPYWWQVRARNATGTTDANGGTWWSFAPANSVVARVNVAAAANGATAAASSVHSSGWFPLSGTINGDRLGLNWGNGGGWNDGTFAEWPDWLEVSFAGSQTINEIDVFTIQDDYRAPVTPTLALTTIAGLTDFRIESWNGSAWVVVPGGTITGTNKVWTQVTFAPITTTKIRIWITSSLDNWSRVAELEAWSTTPDAGQPPSLLLSENFDQGGFASRGWYDINGDFATSADTRPGGGTGALLWHWRQGNDAPDAVAAGRFRFSPTDRVYLSYWVKYSDNWTGSGQSAHPHEVMLLTNEDDAYVGPAYTHLTAYVEHNWRANGGVPVVSMQDGRNIDRTRLNTNLVGVSENRATHGCNGIGDAFTTAVACYAVTPTIHFNGRQFGDLNTPQWSNDVTSPSYKGAWHKVEAYFQLNTVTNGVGQADGIIRYWFDGRPVLDLAGVLMRTGQYPNMRFNQLMLGPYMGNGSPVEQRALIDDLVVARERVP